MRKKRQVECAIRILLVLLSLPAADAGKSAAAENLQREDTPSRPILEIHAVTKTATPTSRPYSLPLRDGRSETLLVEPEVLLDQTAITFANLGSDSDGSPRILISLSKEGAKKFGDI